MITDFATLKTSVLRFLLRASTDLVVTDDQLALYIQLCEAELNRELRVRELEEVYPVTLTIAQNYVALPDDFKKVKDFIFNSAPFDIKYSQTFGEMVRAWSQMSGRPREYTITGERIYFSHLPDFAHTMTFEYYKAIEALSGSNTTNVILEAYPDLYLYGTLRQAYINLKDKANTEIVGTNYAGIIERIKVADMESRMPSSLKQKTRSRLA